MNVHDWRSLGDITRPGDPAFVQYVRLANLITMLTKYSLEGACAVVDSNQWSNASYFTRKTAQSTYDNGKASIKASSFVLLLEAHVLHTGARACRVSREPKFCRSNPFNSSTADYLRKCCPSRSLPEIAIRRSQRHFLQGYGWLVSGGSIMFPENLPSSFVNKRL